MKVALIALKPIEYRGRIIATGERFEASASTAAALLYQRKAKFAPAKALIPEIPPEPPRRRYRRRDMQAGD